MKKFLPALIVFCLVLTGCGGGGGSPQVLGPQPVGPENPIEPPPPPDLPTLPDTQVVQSPPSSARTIEQLENFYGTYLSESIAGGEFGLINLDSAYANLYMARGADESARPGNGVTIGFIDTGLDTAHPAFHGKRMTVEYFGSASAGSDLKNGGSHGTSVASIAAGVRQDWQFPSEGREVGFVTRTSEGVAPGANIRMLAIPLGSPPPDYQISAPTEGGLREFDLFQTSVLRAALSPDRNIDILNLSFGTDSNISDYSEIALRNSFGEEIQILAQSGRSNKTLLVWAAGNENEGDCVNGTPSCVNGEFDASSPGIQPGLTYRIPELRPHSVAVVAVKQDGTITDFSSRCGVAADWCIAAPGEEIGVAYSRQMSDGSIKRSVSDRYIGTSFAAPIVSGGLAFDEAAVSGSVE